MPGWLACQTREIRFFSGDLSRQAQDCGLSVHDIAPGLGVVGVDDHEFVLADIPGLVEGAHEGIGLGHRFLGHVERCQVLLHLVDGTADDPVGNWQTIRKELAAYDEDLGAKQEITAISKTIL